MRYYLDCEFNGLGGGLISLALVREDRKSIYLVYALPALRKLDSWVRANIIPILRSIPTPLPGGMSYDVDPASGVWRISEFLKGDPDPIIVTDWPDDIAYFCRAIITKPGEMAAIPQLKFEMHRVDAYPTRLADAVQHNAWWDAHALRQKLIDNAEFGP